MSCFGIEASKTPLGETSIFFIEIYELEKDFSLIISISY